MPTISASRVTVDVDVDFEVFCGKCGAGLCNDSETGNTRNRGMPYVRVMPCSACMEREYDAGYDKGYAACEKESA